MGNRWIRVDVLVEEGECCVCKGGWIEIEIEGGYFDVESDCR